jgi:uncharacterized protein (DUF58 family)
MNRWLPTPALGRAVIVGAVGVAAAVLLGSPVVMVLVGPLVGYAAFALRHRPHSQPSVSSGMDHRVLNEGQGTTSRLRVNHPEDVEHVTRIMTPAPYVALHPANGVLGRLHDPGSDEIKADIEVGPRRWGRRVVGEELVGLVTPWAGYRFGPVPIAGDQLRVLPQAPPFDSRTGAPRPVGLVGANRSQRLGAGTEFADIRPFRAGDRLRRISWRVSVRTGELHVTTSPAEQDSGVLLVLDALADHGHAGGIDGEASSLDLGVRAAAALAIHHVRVGDRVGLRVVGGDGGHLRYGSGSRHLHVLMDKLSAVRPGDLPAGIADRIQLGVQGGSLVFVLSPMLGSAIVTATASLVRSGLAVVVVDTLPPGAKPDVPEGVDPRVADLAWRMRKLEQEQWLAGLAALGCPVVPWRGPGTVDDVLQRLARRGGRPVAAS